MRTEALDSFCIVLTVKLVRMQRCAELCKSTSNFRHKTKESFFIVYDEIHVIDKALVLQTLANNPIVNFVEVIVYGILPY